ncbi:hypothetical protein D3C85_1104700 [compost metagenome]
MPGGVATGERDDNPGRHLALLVERPQLALVRVQEVPGAGPDDVLNAVEGVVGEIGRLKEFDIRVRHVHPQVRTHLTPQPLVEQPANMVHVNVGRDDIGHGPGMDAGALQS